MGYDSGSTNYGLYDPVARQVFVSRNVVFNEQSMNQESSETNIEVIFPLTNESDDEGGDVKGNGVVRDETEAENEVVENAVAEDVIVIEDEVEQGQQQDGRTPRTLRNRALIHPPARYALCLVEHNIPTTYEEAMSSPEAAQWAEAIDEELESLEKNETWKIVPRAPGEKTIDSRWVFKILRDEDGNVARLKAHLCARGFMQREGIDYSETFSPVVRYDSLRVLLAVITQLDLETVQFDGRTAFLHGILDEEIRMEVPVGLRDNEEAKCRGDVVCLLRKSLWAQTSTTLLEPEVRRVSATFQSRGDRRGQVRFLRCPQRTRCLSRVVCRRWDCCIKIKRDNF